MKLRHDGPPEAPATVILAHGAGAGMDSPAMVAFAEGLAAAGLHAVRFEFPYMQRRRETGKRGGPDRAPVLLESWRGVIDGFDRRRLIIGGKSMGGRIASMVADDAGVRGLVCLGYPFHPPGRPEKLRTEHLAGLQTPTLIVQGTRDPFGNAGEVPGYELSSAIAVHWLEDGDHSFKPRKSSGRTLAQNIEEAVAAIAGFIEGLAAS
ncbi:MAG TPA: alpha/beta family hydrolase [Acidobacteriota bacterium]